MGMKLLPEGDCREGDHGGGGGREKKDRREIGKG